MRSSIAFLSFFTLFAFLLCTFTIEARKDPGESWRDVIKDEAMQEAIKKLLNAEIASYALDYKQQLIKGIKQKNKFVVKDLRPRPNISIYHDNEKSAELMDKNLESKVRKEPCGDHQKEIKFAKEFKADPMISAYHD